MDLFFILKVTILILKVKGHRAMEIPFSLKATITNSCIILTFDINGPIDSYGHWCGAPAAPPIVGPVFIYFYNRTLNFMYNCVYVRNHIDF